MNHTMTTEHQNHGGDSDLHVGHDVSHGEGHHPGRDSGDGGADPGDHGGHGGHGGHADHIGMFRRRFWWSLLLSVPVVLTSHMIMDWFGYTLDFPGIEWVGPILGTVIYAWAGWPFLAGGWQELRDRRPGMMLLITMAITVAYAASLATSLGWFDLEFWWELAALVTIMLLGHWQEMKALGQASSALDALAALLPDTADHVMADGTIHTMPVADLRPGDIVLVRSGARVPADGVIVEGAAELDESMVTGESRPIAKASGDPVVAGTVSTDSAIRVRVDKVGDRTPLWQAFSGSSPRRRHRRVERKRWPTASLRCCSTSPPLPVSRRTSSGRCSGTPTMPWCGP